LEVSSSFQAIPTFLPPVLMLVGGLEWVAAGALDLEVEVGWEVVGEEEEEEDFEWEAEEEAEEETEEDWTLQRFELERFFFSVLVRLLSAMEWWRETRWPRASMERAAAGATEMVNEERKTAREETTSSLDNMAKRAGGDKWVGGGGGWRTSELRL
jgi:hypothetical protein